MAGELIIGHRERLIAQDDAELLRKYKKLLAGLNVKEKLWCQHCEERGDHPGVSATVTDGSINFRCRCTTRTYRGQTY